MLVVVAPVVVRAQEGKLVLYTSQPNQDAQQTIDAFKAKYPKVDITFVRDGTPRIVAKLRAEIEAGAAQADLLLIADAVTMEDLKNGGRLLPYPEADVASYAADLHDKDRTWFATKLITTGIIYNTRAPFRPQSWSDLLKDETRGQV
ncbi:MAG: extracellular solute-binding protein, partial [Pseudorhodoplanes sp.]|nr:extracellular solute-binding protein [Pseudorhodoplanes sp.]